MRARYKRKDITAVVVVTPTLLIAVEGGREGGTHPTPPSIVSGSFAVVVVFG